VLGVLLIVNAFLLINRADVETIILRTPGMLYQEVDETTLSNLYNYQVVNKTSKEMELEFRLSSDYDYGSLKLIGNPPVTSKGSVAEGAFFIYMPKDQLNGRKNKIVVEVYHNGELIDEAKTSFLGPAN
jgi:hypothetical protein